MLSLVHFEQNLQDVHNLSGEVNTGETQERNMEEDAPSYPPAPQEESNELWVRQESAGMYYLPKLDMNFTECKLPIVYLVWCI